MPNGKRREKGLIQDKKLLRIAKNHLFITRQFICREKPKSHHYTIVLLIGGLFLYFFFTSMINATNGTIWHTKVPLEIQGRVLAASGMVLTGSTQIGYLLSGVLADRVFIPAVAAGGFIANNFGQFIGQAKEDAIALMFLLMGIICLLATFCAYLYKPLRLLDQTIADRGESSPSDKKLEQIDIRKVS